MGNGGTISTIPLDGMLGESERNIEENKKESRTQSEYTKALLPVKCT